MCRQDDYLDSRTLRMIFSIWEAFDQGHDLESTLPTRTLALCHTGAQGLPMCVLAADRSRAHGSEFYSCITRGK